MAEVSDIFECSRCGYCCHGETTVSLDREDQQVMVAVLGGERDVVCKKYWRLSQTLETGEGQKSSRVVQMKTVDGRCIFYFEDEKGLGGCRVHEGRPWRCGQWPLHPAILGGEDNFETIRNSCPGITRELAYEEFCVILKELMAEGRIRC